MIKKLIPNRFKDISITKKLYFVVGTMAVLIAIELFSLWFSIQALSAVRSLVGAEGLYSKAQKDATYQLQKYYHSRDEADFESFRDFIKVPLGDHKTRIALSLPTPDIETARQGFLEGRVHPEDIDGMIKLLLRFHNNAYIKSAIQSWTTGDSLIAQLVPVGEKLHAEITSKEPSQAKLDEIIKEVDPLNKRLTKLEDEFSYTLGAGSRWLKNLVLTLLFLVAITVEVTGLTLTIFVTKGMTKGLNEINRASKKISNGEFNERATVFSNDEIGQVALAINQMAEQLILTNGELRQFAYMASHDLQEPLKTISNYVGLLQVEYEGKLEGDADRYLGVIIRASARMKFLIKDILDYAHIGIDKKLITIDCNVMLTELLTDMATSIKESKSIIQYQKLPTITAYHELNYLFLNLISNAIKFRKPGEQLLLKIRAEEKPTQWLFAISDNGIGIEKQFHERIFTIFQKLHSKKNYSGSGVGLAHCKKVAELHGGKIWVDSALNKGSTFYFSIPKNIGNE